jgi:hypothetical protein
VGAEEEPVSVIHYTLVGHFDPRKVFVDGVRDLKVARPLDRAEVEALLAEYPEVVSAQVRLLEGYARCQWAPSTATAEVFEFAYRLARAAGALAVENGRQVMWPPEAARTHGEVMEKLLRKPGLAAEWEAEAKKQAAAFEAKMQKRAAVEKPRAAKLQKALAEIARRRYPHVERAGCVVKDDGGWPAEDTVKETLEYCAGDRAVAEELLNRRTVLTDVLEPIAPGESWSADDLRAAAQALAAAIGAQLARERPTPRFVVEVVGAALAGEEPLEVAVTFHRAG